MSHSAKIFFVLLVAIALSACGQHVHTTSTVAQSPIIETISLCGGQVIQTKDASGAVKNYRRKKNHGIEVVADPSQPATETMCEFNLNNEEL